MPPFRNPVEARRKKDRPIQKVADENCYMSSADFSEKYHNTRQGAVTDRPRRDHSRQGPGTLRGLGKKTRARSAGA